MSNNKDRSLDRIKDSNESFFGALYNNLRLILRLIKDRRVNFFLKILPIGALIYLVSPLDFFPVNPLDDGLVMWLGGYLFIELCPEDIVQEHRKALQQSLMKDDGDEEPQHDVVEGEFTEVPSENEQ